MLEAVEPQQRTLPRSEEAERAVLAGVLLDPIQLPSVTARLGADDFYSDRHRILYQAMLVLQSESTTIDVRTLQAQLEQEDRLERAGGIAYIASLDLDLPDLSRLDSYIEIVKERSLRRQLIQTCSDITRDCLDGGVKARNALDKAESRILGLSEEAVTKGFVGIGRVLDEMLPDLEERPTEGIIEIPTGLSDLDDMTRGLNRGNLVILAGRPGMGKTSLALNMAQNVAIRAGRPVGIFSLEMSQEELALRILSSESRVPFRSFRTGHISQRQWNQAIATVRTISSAPIFIDDTANPSLLEVASKARRLKAEHGLDLLILDYLQLMHGGNQYENRNLEIASMTRQLKGLAKELDLPVIALSQLSRQTERRGKDHRPQLSDLRESGSIEQDADVVVFIYREWIYNPEPENEGKAELIIAKHRNGETGTIDVAFLGDTTSFHNLARDDYGAPPN